VEGLKEEIYSLARRVEIVGLNLPPGRDLALGIYHRPLDSADAAALAHSQMVSTENRGTVRTFLDVDPSYVPGCYAVIVVTDPNLNYRESPYRGRLEFAGPSGCFRVP